MISVILTVFNQQDILPMVLNGIAVCSSDLIGEVIIILDGCTDNSEKIVKEFNLYPFPKRILYSDNVFEVKANNIGLRASNEPYCMLIQDDMVVEELFFAERMIAPMLKWSDVFAVTARSAHDNEISNGELCYVHLAGREAVTPRNIFAIRDSVNRGPLLLRHDVLEQVNYLDEDYAPLSFDDHDLCYRAYYAGGWKAGAFRINYRSDFEWGTSRKTSVNVTAEANARNKRLFMQRHYQALTGPHHTEDRILE